MWYLQKTTLGSGTHWAHSVLLLWLGGPEADHHVHHGFVSTASCVRCQGTRLSVLVRSTWVWRLSSACCFCCGGGVSAVDGDASFVDDDEDGDAEASWSATGAGATRFWRDRPALDS